MIKLIVVADTKSLIIADIKEVIIRNLYREEKTVIADTNVANTVKPSQINC